MSYGRLDLKYADSKTATFELTKRQVTVGRASDVDVPVNDGQVSRRHALLLCGPEGVRLVDAGSANGTFLGKDRLPAQQPIPLTDGVTLRVGSTLIRFTAGSGQVEAAPAEPMPASAPVTAMIRDKTKLMIFIFYSSLYHIHPPRENCPGNWISIKPEQDHYGIGD